MGRVFYLFILLGLFHPFFYFCSFFYFFVRTMVSANEGLSKETRKLRKKKHLSESEDEWQQPQPRSRLTGKKKEPKAPSAARARACASVAAMKDETSVVPRPLDELPIEEDPALMNSTPPLTPTPDAPAAALDDAHQHDPNYDSIDDYDTDDLLDQVDNLGPLRLKLPTTRKRATATPSIATLIANARAKVLRQKKVNKVVYNHERTTELSKRHPDPYWRWDPSNGNMVHNVNDSAPLVSIKRLAGRGPVLGMALSEDGALLATFASSGIICLWDAMDDFHLIMKLRDTNEQQIEEYYCGQIKDGLLIAGGKLKDRHRWSTEDDDNHILPCPIKVFNLETKKVESQLHGHAEEILCLKWLTFDDKNYYISTSQDGYIIKWHMEADWKTLIEYEEMGDGITCMAFGVSFIPNTGNKYFLGACDAHIRLYDFEEAQLMQTFENMYSSYCDCGKFIKWLDADLYLEQQRQEQMLERVKSQMDDDEEMLAEGHEDETQRPCAWFISRGAELCDGTGVATTPNTCTLHRLLYPTETGGQFTLEEVKRLQNADYHANSWYLKIASNGRYLFAPTIYGQIFSFNILTGQLTAILKDHQDVEIRDVALHPFLPLLFSCGDDGSVNIYSYPDPDDVDAMFTS
ncbi:WD40-repeat-containing domain protein [Gongronella butleri]|nr:WD40-repeat-containing domain protein [Gongronella butleri]